MVEIAADVTHPQGYIRYSRTVAVTRLVLVGGLVGLLAFYTTPRIAALGLVEFVLYLALLAASELARRSQDGPAAVRRLRRQADALMVLLVANACALAAAISLHDGGRLRVEAALLAICVLLFAALRAHQGRLSYVVGVAPPAATLIWLALEESGVATLGVDALAMCLFVGAVLVVTWRQQASDTALGRVAQDLRRKTLALTHAADEAREAIGARSRLLAATSHEVRTPLNAVLGFAQALRRQPLAPTQDDLARGIVDGGEQLSRLLDGILAAAEGEKGAARLDLAPFDLRQRVQGVARIWREAAAAMGVELLLVDDTPEVSFDIVADGAKIELALVTLVAGALKVTPSGGRVRIRLAGLARGGRLGVLLEVADTGPAMSFLDRARAFEAFGETERGRQSGDSGLALARSSANVVLMDGEMGVETPPEGTGAVFWFAFNAPAHMAPSSLHPTVARRLRVLAAEDNAANRRVLEALLGHLPVDLVFAEDGAQAVSVWRGGCFDLILMDANMPVMSGVDAVRTIRAESGGTGRPPIWMLTANVSDEDVAAYHDAGADGILRKPIDSVALFDLLAEVSNALDPR
ncbi:response regulator [Phenylobacterium kunshanense]|uniref:histidine kinase n=1 Tax=Phenylobacterium kunshanense TaxID=1445034 RepID=A0A328BI64_9CAUL|nr:response regulator [Phenylobacterium kunshanense]RAK64738.1 hybrid sensor histidine kinase/response regulator [Phenylobacterium kunshanense]